MKHLLKVVSIFPLSLVRRLDAIALIGSVTAPAFAQEQPWPLRAEAGKPYTTV
jgi:hypothetical protein